MLESKSQPPDLAALNRLARDIRLDILEMTTRAGSGHPSSSWSATDIVVALLFGGVLRYRSDEPDWPERDRFIMSKGHAAPLLYAALARAGYFSRAELWRLREINSPVQGHPIQGLMPGVEATTGSLGQGLSAGDWSCPGRPFEQPGLPGLRPPRRRRMRSRADLGGGHGRGAF